MVKIKLSLTRDQTKTIADFIPLWLMICDSKLIGKIDTENYRLSWTLFKSIIEELQKQFDKRLFSFSKNHRFNFTRSQAIILNEFLLKHPIAADQFYLHQLRQLVINTIHPQI